MPIFGGRNWTVFCTASLLLPTLWMALAIQDPSTNYAVFVAIALLCGLGGGNFSASMANISFFFPKRMQGTALGWNAGVGNLGVGVMQAVVPLTIYGGALAIMGGSPQTYTDGALVTKVWMQNAAFIWIPFILAATIAAAWGQNNIRDAQASLREQVGIFRRKHAWILAWLYTGTFGSFIGFAAAFPQLLSTYFPTSEAKHWAFVGPLLGALVRPFGGWLSDRLGGGKVTFWNFAVMLVAAIAILGIRCRQRKAAPASHGSLRVSCCCLSPPALAMARCSMSCPMSSSSCTRARRGKTRPRRNAPPPKAKSKPRSRSVSPQPSPRSDCSSFPR